MCEGGWVREREGEEERDPGDENKSNIRPVKGTYFRDKRDLL